MPEKTYIAIDLKSFYASVECRELGKDPLSTNLVVADRSRTDKTICLAVSPSLKAHGISGRARLFEVVQQVKRVNAGRRAKAPGGDRHSIPAGTSRTGGACTDRPERWPGAAFPFPQTAAVTTL